MIKKMMIRSTVMVAGLYVTQVVIEKLEKSSLNRDKSKEIDSLEERVEKINEDLENIKAKEEL